MAIQGPNTLIAHKAINLAVELSSSEKRVAGAIIDHFNRKTGQCDPSLDRIAQLIGMSRRTVMRAADQLHQLGFIRRIRHGGHFHRNSYEPVWSKFDQVEAEWNARRRMRRTTSSRPNVSPSGGQPSHPAGDTADPQTLPRNLSKETLPAATASQAMTARTESRGRNGSARVPDLSATRPIAASSPGSRTAAYDAAERRWNDDLLSRYRDQPSLYGQVVDAIDRKLMRDTTEAELRMRGCGLIYLMEHLTSNGRSDVASQARGGGGYQNFRGEGDVPVG